MLNFLLSQVVVDFGLISKATAIAVVAIAAGMGISKISVSASEGIARQPEAGGDLRMNMIISAALIEGVALFALVVLGFIL